MENASSPEEQHAHPRLMTTHRPRCQQTWDDEACALRHADLGRWWTALVIKCVLISSQLFSKIQAMFHAMSYSTRLYTYKVKIRDLCTFLNTMCVILRAGFALDFALSNRILFQTTYFPNGSGWKVKVVFGTVSTGWYPVYHPVLPVPTDRATGLHWKANPTQSLHRDTTTCETARYRRERQISESHYPFWRSG